MERRCPAPPDVKVRQYSTDIQGIRSIGGWDGKSIWGLKKVDFDSQEPGDTILTSYLAPGREAAAHTILVGVSSGNPGG